MEEPAKAEQKEEKNVALSPAQPEAAPEKPVQIDIDTFKKADIRIGEIRAAEKVENADKLLKLKVFFGGEEERQIISGIAAYFPDPETLVGRRVAFAYNLAPRTIRGYESQGMILAASSDDSFALLEAPAAAPGSRIK